MTRPRPDQPSSLSNRVDESEEQTLDRNMNEMLQELRVAQTGVQILFAFLLTIAFTPVFQDVTQFQKTVYVITLLASASASALIIAPVAYHRLVFRQRKRRELVAIANRMAVGGLLMLLLAMVGSVVLILDVVIPGWLSWVLSGLVAALFAGIWFALPLVRRRTR